MKRGDEIEVIVRVRYLRTVRDTDHGDMLVVQFIGDDIATDPVLSVAPEAVWTLTTEKEENEE
jgi:hypothetical protein